MNEEQYVGNSVENENADSHISLLHRNEVQLASETTGSETIESSFVDADLDVQEWLDTIELRPRQYLDPLYVWILAATVFPAYIMFAGPLRFYWEVWPWILEMLFVPITAAAITSRVSRLRCEAREDQLAASADVHWIGRLVKALDSSHPRRRVAARRILPRLLTKVKPGDAGLLDIPQQADLIYTLRLNRPQDMDLNVGIIKALERVGDEAALGAIEYVADTIVWLPSQRFVQRAARFSAVRMEARLAAKPPVLDAVVVDEITPAYDLPVKQRESIPEVDALKQRLKDEREGRTAPVMRRPFLFAAWATLLPGSLWLTISSIADKEFWPAAAYGALFLFAARLPRYVLSQKQAIAAQRLAAFNNVHGVGPLAEALEWPDPAIKTTAAQSLERLLPQLNASDGGLLTTAQRGCLHRVLRMSNARQQEALIVAILKALEQVGDESAVPYVKQLATGHARTRVQQRVQDHARECLPFLEAGAIRRQGSQTLLRASSIDATQPDVLLRSASGASVTEPAQLLRAGVERE